MTTLRTDEMQLAVLSGTLVHGAFWHFGCVLVRFGAFWHFGCVLVRFGTLGAFWCVLVRFGAGRGARPQCYIFMPNTDAALAKTVRDAGIPGILRQ